MANPVLMKYSDPRVWNESMPGFSSDIDATCPQVEYQSVQSRKVLLPCPTEISKCICHKVDPGQTDRASKVEEKHHHATNTTCICLGFPLDPGQTATWITHNF